MDTTAAARALDGPIADLTKAFAQYRLWLGLGWTDIKLRYRGSILGPLWITLSMGIFVAAISGVYAKLFNQPIAEYVPFLTCGVICWGFISNVIAESSDLYISNRAYVLNHPLPRWTLILRHVWRHVIILGHNMIVYLVVAYMFKISPGTELLWFIPSTIVVLLNLCWITATVGLVSARFRDIPPILNSLLLVAFLISPITWMPNQIPTGNPVLVFNPFAYMLDAMRSPLLGHSPQIATLPILLAIATGGFITTFLLYRYRSQRIPFWL